jgi:hypothetical protein
MALRYPYDFTGPEAPEDLTDSLATDPIDPYMPGPADYEVAGYTPQTYGGQPLLESLGGLEQLQLPQAHGLGEGLLYGLTRGLGAAGTRALERRAKFERDQTRRQAAADQERIAASREYRAARGAALRQKEGDRLSTSREQAKYEQENPIVTPELQALNPALARIPVGTRVPASVAYAAPPDRSSLNETIRHNKAIENIDRTKANVAAVKPSTGEQKQALAFYNRGKEALDILNQPGQDGQTLEDRIASVPAAGAAFGQRVPNFLKGNDRQKYEQAQRAFTQAKLRKESGAAISAQEYQSDAQTYFAQPGDTPDVIANKKAARDGVLAGLKFQAGPAYNEFYGDQGGAPAAPGAATASPASVPKPGGWFDKNKPGGS